MIDFNRIVETLSCELKTGTDRHIAIIGAAFVEFALDFAISNRLANRPDIDNKLFKSPRKKWNFATKIDVAALLHMLSTDDESDANTIREIRNCFAHELFGDFTSNKGAELSFECGLVS